MTFVLGFGSTEQEFERQEETAIREYIEERYVALGLDYFTDVFVKEITAWVKARGEAYKARDAEYKTAADYPSRYSSYWSSVLSDASHIVVILSVFHTNRRHAMSPDGWACMITKPVFLFENLDMPRAERTAA